MDSGCDRVMATEPLCRRCPATCSLSSGPWLPCCSVAWALRAAADPEWALLSSMPGGPRCRARARVRHMRKGQATWAEGVTAASQKAQWASCSAGQASRGGRRARGSGCLSSNEPFPPDSLSALPWAAGTHQTSPGLGALAGSCAVPRSPQMGLSQLTHLPGIWLNEARVISRVCPGRIHGASACTASLAWSPQGCAPPAHLVPISSGATSLFTRPLCPWG